MSEKFISLRQLMLLNILELAADDKIAPFLSVCFLPFLLFLVVGVLIII